MSAATGKSSGNRIFIIITLLLLLISGIMAWQLYSQKKERQRLEMERQELLSETERINSELEEILTDYDQLEDENQDLSTELEKETSKVEQLKRQLLKARAQIKNLKKYRDELWSFKKKYEKLEAVRDSLVAANEKLRGENKRIKKHLAEQQETTAELTEENMALAGKVAKGKQLTALKLAAHGIRIRGDKEKETNKARKTDEVRVCFVLGENPLAEAGQKEIFLRIEGPGGMVLAKNLGASNELRLNDGKRVAFSTSEKVVYKNDEIPLCIYYPKNVEFEHGNYRVIVYADGVEIGNTTFELL